MPGKENVPADVLSRYGHDAPVVVAPMATHAMDDPECARVMTDWIRVMAPHLTLSHCVDAAVQALQAGRSLSPLSCRKCKKLHLDEGTWAA